MGDGSAPSGNCHLSRFDKWLVTSARRFGGKRDGPRWVIQNILKKEEKPMWKKVIVRETERALVLERGRLAAVLPPGVHRVWTFARGI